MSSPIKGQEAIFNQINQHLSQLRPCQLVSIAGIVTGVALTAMGLATGNIPAIVIGASIGYLSYNSYQVLTNLDNPGQSTFSGITSSISNAFTGNGPTNLSLNILGKNTIGFDWAVESLSSNLLQTSTFPSTFLDGLDNSIYNGISATEQATKQLARQIANLVQDLLN